MIIAVPAAVAVPTPVDDTTLTPPVLLQTPPGVAQLNVVTSPAHIVDGPVMGPTVMDVDTMMG